MSGTESNADSSSSFPIWRGRAALSLVPKSDDRPGERSREGERGTTEEQRSDAEGSRETDCPPIPSDRPTLIAEGAKLRESLAQCTSHLIPSPE